VNGARGQLCRFVMLPGTSTPAPAPVRHEAEQLSVLFSGRLNLRLGEQEEPVGAGSVWFIPSQVEHFSTILEAPSVVLDFHVPHRPEFTDSGEEPEPGPPPAGGPRFSSWAEAGRQAAGDGVAVQRLTGERSEVERVLADRAGVALPALDPGVEHICTVVGGTLAVRVGDLERTVGAGTVWTVPEGRGQQATVREAPLELLAFRTR